MHIILHALCLIVQCVTEALQLKRLEQNIALNAKTEQFITAKISSNALKQGSRTHSVLCLRSSQLQKYRAAHNSGVKHTQRFDRTVHRLTFKTC